MTFSQRALPFLLTLAVLFSTFTASAFSTIPNQMNVAGKQLVLNGVGTRTKFILSIYHAGLYLQKKNNNAQQIIAANEPMAIRMNIVSGFASASKMKHALNQGFKNSTGGKTAPIQAQINQLLKAAFSGKINKGDIMDLVYNPATGTQIIKNKKVLATLKGLPFKQALFGIWLSNKPAQASLKNQMLGGK
jgi:hypothetical protein